MGKSDTDGVRKAGPKGNAEEKLEALRQTDDVKYVYEKLGGVTGWVEACQEDKTVKNDFYRNILRPRIEAERRKNQDMADDGREILLRVEALLRAYEESK